MERAVDRAATAGPEDDRVEPALLGDLLDPSGGIARRLQQLHLEPHLRE